MNFDTVSIEKEYTRDNYKSYTISIPARGVMADKYVSTPVGRVVFERHSEGWHLELMNVTYPGRGIGSKAISLICNDLDISPSDISVDPIDKDSRRFFSRLGFKC